MLHFTKMNGAGNDFIVLDNSDGTLKLNKTQIAKLCDRHHGIGADGLLILELPQNSTNFRMRYYNADGSEAEMCGNGARCFGRFAANLSGKTKEVSFETPAGIITAQFIGTDVCIRMGNPHSLVINACVLDPEANQLLEANLNLLDIDNLIDDHLLKIHTINTGVPHAVVFVDDVEKIDVCNLGAKLRYHKYFKPQGRNINFVEQIGKQDIKVRTYERGVEYETLSCGTGMVASALIFHKLFNATTPINVHVRSGDMLSVLFQQNNAIYQDVTLTGPAEIVFEGKIELTSQ